MGEHAAHGLHIRGLALALVNEAGERVRGRDPSRRKLLRLGAPRDDDHVRATVARVRGNAPREMVPWDDGERGGDNEAVEMRERAEDGDDGVRVQERVGLLRAEHRGGPLGELDQPERVDRDARVTGAGGRLARKAREREVVGGRLLLVVARRGAREYDRAR